MSLYSVVFRHVLSKLDAEDAHHSVLAALDIAQRVPGGLRLLERIFPPVHTEPSLPAWEALGLTHRSPFGLAAGFDKDGRVALALLALGFGHVEVGTITGQAQPGNPRPRLFRLVKDSSLINRMGFNNQGADAVAKRLARLRRSRRGRSACIGVNIGKTKAVPLEDAADDYRYSARTLAPYASYLAVNVSSPNTPGLRDLQSVESLRPIIAAVQAEVSAVSAWLRREIPVLVKIAPDLHDDDVRAVAELVREMGLHGVIATNTTIERPANLRSSRSEIEQIGAGGLSGPVLQNRAMEILHLLRAFLPDECTVISCGGVRTADDVRDRLQAGANLVQGYTSFVYEGPGWPSAISRALTDR